MFVVRAMKQKFNLRMGFGSTRPLDISWLLRMSTLVVAVSFSLLSGEWAQGAEASGGASAGAAANPRSTESDKVDVTDLEKKYWAQKDTDFSVVQNRLYTKANRFSLNLQYGFLINDPWSDGPTYSASLGYFFSERFGIEGHYQSTKSVDNKALTNLKSQSGTANHGKITGYQGVSANWVPFYAKMSLMNSSIMYFDMAISPGIGVTTYDQQRQSGNQTKMAPTVGIDIAQTFFFSKHVAFRIDYQNRWFQEEVVSYKTSSSVSTEISQTSLLRFGFNFFY